MSSKAFTRQIFTWLAQIKNDHALPASAALVALQMIEHFNEGEGGMAWAGEKTIAEAIGKSVGTVHAIIHKLGERGHLRVEWGKPGRGHSNHYWMLIKTQQAELLEVIKTQQAELLEVGKAQFRDDQKAQSSDGKAQFSRTKAQPTEQNHLKNHLKNQEGKKRALSPGDASLVLKKESGEERNQPQAELVTVADDAFQRFWAVYPRKVEQDEARTAFAAAIKAGADIEGMISRATVYAVERATAIRDGDLPKWTLYPATWLKKKKWNDPLPEGAICDELGNVVAIEQEEENGEDDFDTSFREFERAVGYKEDGSW
jgi:hypothetical protein